MSTSEINPEVADAVAQINAMVVGMAPAMAMGSLYQNLANAAAMAAMNAVHAQQQTFIVHQTVTTRNVAMLLSLLEK